MCKKSFYIINFFVATVFLNTTSAQGLRCMNLFKDSFKQRSAKAIVSYLKQPSQFLIKDSLRLEKTQQLAGLLVPSLKANFKELTLVGKWGQAARLPNQWLSKVLFQKALQLDKAENFVIAPINFLMHNTFVRPTRFITGKSKFFDREYEPSTLLSALVSAGYLYYLVSAPIQNIVKDKQQAKADFLIKNDYRYASLLPLYNKAQLLKEKLNEKNLSEKEKKQLTTEWLFIRYRLKQLILNKKQYYEVFFFNLLQIKKEVLSDAFLKPLGSTKTYKASLALLNDLANQLPTLFLEKDQWVDSKKVHKPLNGFLQMDIKNKKTKEEVKNTILMHLVKKHIRQEAVWMLLYSSAFKNKDFMSQFSLEVKEVELSSMYKQLMALQEKNKITKGQFLRSMQEFIQWQFNMSVWKELGLQRLVIKRKANGAFHYTDKVLTLKKIKESIIKELNNRILKK